MRDLAAVLAFACRVVGTPTTPGREAFTPGLSRLATTVGRVIVRPGVSAAHVTAPHDEGWAIRIQLR